MSFIIREATKKDMLHVLNFIKELALFEKEAKAVEITVNDLKNDGFGKNPLFKWFVAEINNTIEGIALVYNRYSTWKGTVLHLEDLIVNPKIRGLGLGTALLDKVVKYGNDLGVKRISWEVLDWNKNAIEFYNKKGAKVLSEWKVVQLDKQGMKNYLSKID